MEINELKEDMIKKNQIFKIKKGHPTVIVTSEDYECEGSQVHFIKNEEDKFFHPDWLVGVVEDDSSDLRIYQFGSQFKEISHFEVISDSIEMEVLQ